jgi:hypothetical protein
MRAMRRSLAQGPALFCQRGDAHEVVVFVLALSVPSDLVGLKMPLSGTWRARKQGEHGCEEWVFHGVKRLLSCYCHKEYEGMWNLSPFYKQVTGVAQTTLCEKRRKQSGTVLQSFSKLARVESNVPDFVLKGWKHWRNDLWHSILAKVKQLSLLLPICPYTLRLQLADNVVQLEDPVADPWWGRSRSNSHSIMESIILVRMQGNIFNEYMCVFCPLCNPRVVDSFERESMFRIRSRVFLLHNLQYLSNVFLTYQII